MAFKTLRLVHCNLGTGGDDFWVIERRCWWFPFWVWIPRAYLTFSEAVYNFERLKKRKTLRFSKVIKTHPE